jgi:purine-binding chemotaxis protein CheW
MTPATSSSSSKTGAGAVQPPCNYGGFRLGKLHLAVPMNALREIVPCDTLVPLRGMAACIAGGLQRGQAVIPVVDLRSALGQPLGSAAGTSVLLVAHEGELLGLLAHDVTGVLQGVTIMADPRSAASRNASPLINGHLPQPDGSNLRVLSLAAVAALPQARTQPKPAKRPRWAPAWLQALAHALRPRPPAPTWRVQSAQMSGMWDTVVPGVRG